MTIRLGDNQYGKAETHMVRVTKGGPDNSVHEIKDLNVSVALAGDFAASHLEGDNSNIVPTDTQRNTVYAFAKEADICEIEEFALRLARHFAHDFPTVQRSRISIEECHWARIDVGRDRGIPPPSRAPFRARLSTCPGPAHSDRGGSGGAERGGPGATSALVH